MVLLVLLLSGTPGFELAGSASFESFDFAQDSSRATSRDELCPPQDTFNIKELAEYRLTVPVFKQFVHASRLIVTAAHDDPRLANDPLFTRDISVLDDVVAAAGRVEARLKFEPRYTSALRIASISARDYAKFALALFAARMAHGFLESGAIRGVTKGPASENVAFVAEHAQEVTDVLRALGVEGAQ